MIEVAQQAIQFFQSAPIVIRIVSSALSFLVILFFFRFLLPALWMDMRFSSVIRRLQHIRRKKEGDVASAFTRDRTLNHLWTEYEHTIHKQYKQVYTPAENGQNNPPPEPLLRSTVPAATIFTTEAMVDSRLSTEFFKHLPGLFTGIGIIGTFSGLIQGLQAFKVSENAAVVRNSLEVLMHGVYEAFLVSAVAISAAMVATALERWLIAGLYKKAEAITFEIDGMFESGVGEEYLERLVSAAEEGANQSKILKDALVTELGNILANLTERQIEAQNKATRALGVEISKGIETGLAEPLKRIANTAGETKEDNTQAVANLLTDVLAGFSQRLEELFGGQIGGINQLQQNTVESLTKATAALEATASKIETAGTNSSEAMARILADAVTSMEGHQQAMNDRMAGLIEQIRGSVRDEQKETNRALQLTIAELGEAVRSQIKALNEAGNQAADSHAEREGQMAKQADETAGKLTSLTEGVIRSSEAISQKLADAMMSMEGNQRTMNDRMAEFVEHIRGLVREEQKETGRALQSAVAELGEAVRLQIAALKEAGDQAAGSHAEREGRMAAQADEAVGKLTSLTEGVMAEIRLLTGEIRQTTTAMHTITADAVARMNVGAETLSRAAEDFSRAGQGVTGVLQQATGISGSLKEAAGSLSSSSSVLKGVIDDHATARENLASMIEQLRGIVENARREAAVTSDALSRIETSAEKLAGAQKQAEEYLAGVTDVLASAHGEFAEGLKKVLTEAHSDFYSRLSSATGLLRDAIEELAATIDIIPSARTKTPERV
jgi:hypothetical protein